MQNDILPGKYYHMPCLHPQSLSLLPYLETADILLTAACGDLLPQYLSPGGLFYVNILVKQICDKEERVKKAGKELCILLKRE